MEPPRNLREYSKEGLASEVERLRTRLELAESIIRKQECFIKSMEESIQEVNVLMRKKPELGEGNTKAGMADSAEIFHYMTEIDYKLDPIIRIGSKVKEIISDLKKDRGTRVEGDNGEIEPEEYTTVCYPDGTRYIVVYTDIVYEKVGSRKLAVAGAYFGMDSSLNFIRTYSDQSHIEVFINNLDQVMEVLKRRGKKDIMILNKDRMMNMKVSQILKVDVDKPVTWEDRQFKGKIDALRNSFRFFKKWVLTENAQPNVFTWGNDEHKINRNVIETLCLETFSTIVAKGHCDFFRSGEGFKRALSEVSQQMKAMVSGYMADVAGNGAADIGVIDTGEGGLVLGEDQSQRMDAALREIRNLYKENIKKIKDHSRPMETSS